MAKTAKSTLAIATAGISAALLLVSCAASPKPTDVNDANVTYLPDSNPFCVLTDDVSTLKLAVGKLIDRSATYITNADGDWIIEEYRVDSGGREIPRPSSARPVLGEDGKWRTPDGRVLTDSEAKKLNDQWDKYEKGEKRYRRVKATGANSASAINGAGGGYSGFYAALGKDWLNDPNFRKNAYFLLHKKGQGDGKDAQDSNVVRYDKDGKVVKKPAKSRATLGQDGSYRSNGAIVSKEEAERLNKEWDAWDLAWDSATTAPAQNAAKTGSIGVGTDSVVLAPIAAILDVLDDHERRITALERDRDALLRAAGVTDGNLTKAVMNLAVAALSGQNGAGTRIETGKNGLGASAGAKTSGEGKTTSVTPKESRTTSVAGTIGGNGNVSGLQIALGDKPCTLNSAMCYVSMAGVNVRKTPCSDNRLNECKAVRVRTYGETLLPIEASQGTKDAKKTYFLIAKDEWVVSYSLRELDPKAPTITFKASKDVEVIDGVMFNRGPKGDQMPFAGNTIGTIAAGETIYVTGCALGWCKLYGQPGYVFHESVADNTK
jgi:hypothetical protein